MTTHMNFDTVMTYYHLFLVGILESHLPDNFLVPESEWVREECSNEMKMSRVSAICTFQSNIYRFSF